MDDRYIKVVYRTDPIGKEGIVLELTTFDTELYEKDQELKEIPKKTVRLDYEINKSSVIDSSEFMKYIERQLNNKVDEFYKNEIEKLKDELSLTRFAAYVAKNDTKNINPTKIIKGNVTNVDKVVCDVIEGNVINCDNVQCKEIKGHMINCN